VAEEGCGDAVVGKEVFGCLALRSWRRCRGRKPASQDTVLLGA